MSVLSFAIFCIMVTKKTQCELDEGLLRKKNAKGTTLRQWIPIGYKD